ncbi:MAG: aspartate/glutamate racemase family protein, partial [Butyricicoccus sp.]|nr:aspartate/glutamate racemase family protein [Butyricicoccus sp.]
MRHYGYIEAGRDDFEVSKEWAQQMSGIPIGIVLLNVGYPIVPGNVANATTWNFPVSYVKVNNVDSPRLHSKDPAIIDELAAAARELVEDNGVRAVICACGYFGRWQKQLRDRVDVPVYASSLIQIPMIKMGLKKDQKIGVLCAVTRTFDNELLECCGVDDPSCIVIKSMEEAPEFSAIPRDRAHMNNMKCRQEFIDAAKQMVEENPDIGAILLECSDMPPYAADIQNAVNLPVYDFTTMVNWVQNAVMRKPFNGYI